MLIAAPVCLKRGRRSTALSFFFFFFLSQSNIFKRDFVENSKKRKEYIYHARDGLMKYLKEDTEELRSVFLLYYVL